MCNENTIRPWMHKFYGQFRNWIYVDILKIKIHTSLHTQNIVVNTTITMHSLSSGFLAIYSYVQIDCTNKTHFIYKMKCENYNPITTRRLASFANRRVEKSKQLEHNKWELGTSSPSKCALTISSRDLKRSCNKSWLSWQGTTHLQPLLC